MRAVSAGDPAEENLLDGLHAEIASYYTQKVLTHGPTPLGVDWPCVPTQELRFVQLLRLCDFRSGFSLNDIGCGYGALLAYLQRRHRGKPVDYVGVDLSAAMLAEAARLWGKRDNTRFFPGHTSPRIADYCVASGIFNVKLHQPEALWIRSVERTLAAMYAGCRRGFAVNFLAPLGDGITAKPELYRAPAQQWQLFCEQQFGAVVEKLDGYGLREYTLLVRRAGFS